MTFQIKDYSTSPSPAFDAVEDLKEYFGKGFGALSQMLKTAKTLSQFLYWCHHLGIHGYAAIAWYCHIFGGDAKFVIEQDRLETAPAKVRTKLVGLPADLPPGLYDVDGSVSAIIDPADGSLDIQVAVGRIDLQRR